MVGKPEDDGSGDSVWARLPGRADGRWEVAEEKTKEDMLLSGTAAGFVGVLFTEMVLLSRFAKGQSRIVF